MALKSSDIDSFIVNPYDFIINKDKSPIIGGFGEITFVTHKITKKKYVSKKMDINDQEMEHMFKAKIRNLVKYKHPNIVPFFGFYKDKSYGYIYLEEIENGSVDKFIFNDAVKHPVFTQTQKYIICYGIALVMQYLHRNGCIHGDLKVGNVLLDKNLYPCINDFVSSSDLMSEDGSFSPSPYSATKKIFQIPKLALYDDDNSFPIDVYAYGVTLYEIWTESRFMKRCRTAYRLLKAIVNGERDEIPDNVPYEWKEMIEKCWAQDPTHRPTFDDIVRVIKSKIFLTKNINQNDVNKYIKIIEEQCKNLSVVGLKKETSQKTAIAQVIAENSSQKTENSNLANKNTAQKAKTPKVITENSSKKIENSYLTNENAAQKVKITKLINENALQKAEIAKVVAENSSLKTENSNLINENAVQKAEIARISAENSSQKTENSNLVNKNTAQKAEITKLINENATLKAKITRLNVNSAKQKAEISQLYEENKAQKKQIANMEKEISQQNDAKKQKFKILDSEEINQFEKIEEIGAGGSGRVYKVFKKDIYAMKEMNVAGANQDDFRHFIGEYELMNLMNHPNILKTFGFFLSDKNKPPSIILEYCIENLSKKISTKSATSVEIVFYIYQIVEGMKYIHFRHIIHRDLKPSNILIANDGTIKICDFGVSKLMTSEALSMTGGVGTPKFMAPEIVNEEDYDEKVDVYSFGVLLFFLLNNGDLSKIKIVDIFRGKKIDLPEKFTQFAKKLIYDCLKIESKDRPSFKDILRRMEENDFNFLSLSESELEEVHIMIKQHQAKIPSYET